MSSCGGFTPPSALKDWKRSASAFWRSGVSATRRPANQVGVATVTRCATGTTPAISPTVSQGSPSSWTPSPTLAFRASAAASSGMNRFFAAPACSCRAPCPVRCGWPSSAIHGNSSGPLWRNTASSGGRQIVGVRLKQHALGIPQEESYEDLCRVEALEEAELVQVLQPVLLEPQIRGDLIPRVI